MANSFSLYIKKLRNSKQLSQEDIAAQLGITLSAYSKIERGLTDPTFSRMRQIAYILKFDLSEIMYSGKENPLERFQEMTQAENYRFVSKKEFHELKLLVVELQQKIEKLSKT
jgi:transcriptional regulator with XRE-family HTH domain